MKPVFIIADNIVSPIGQTAAENFSLLKSGISGIRLHHRSISAGPFHASLFEEDYAFPGLPDTGGHTRFEQLLMASVGEVLSFSGIDPASKRTVFIVSTTKGNISLLETAPLTDDLKKQLRLYTAARLVADYFQFTTAPVVVSHACISGLVALITGMRLLQSGRFDHAVVAGADLITQFVLSGFQSFHAVSDAPCKPFDTNRNGITLGEAAATMVLSVHPPRMRDGITISGGAVSNDANHISGPSRTGQELHQAIELAMAEAAVNINTLDFISAHGTATKYNDEMESKAFTLSGLNKVPVNSLKGYYGHTLGAAGLLETVVSVHSLRENLILPTLGFEEQGTSQPLNICTEPKKGEYYNCLKTGSGFGGCNAAIVLQKTNRIH